MRTVVISLGGSLVSPEAGKVDVAFLKKFRALILKYVKRGDHFAIIVGGGKVARAWQESLRAVAPTTPNPSSGRRGNSKQFLPLLKGEIKRGFDNDLDWVGIRATQLNAELVRAMFGNAAYPEVVWNPRQTVRPFKIVIGAGHMPGASTDYDAVVRAKTVHAATVVNLSDISYVYDKDPRKFTGAKPLHALSWREYLKRFGTKWVPGANVPFDSKAAHLAARAKIRVAFMDGRDLKNVERFLQGGTFNGTIIG